MSPDGSTFYVAEMMRAASTRSTRTRSPRRASSRPASATHGLYPSRDGTKLYVANRGQDHVGDNTAGRARQRLGDRLRDQERRRDVADPRWREPRHGERQHRRQDAVAQRPLRQRRLRDQHHVGRGAARSRSAASPTVSRSGRNPAATRSATPATCANADPQPASTPRRVITARRRFLRVARAQPGEGGAVGPGGGVAGLPASARRPRRRCADGRAPRRRARRDPLLTRGVEHPGHRDLDAAARSSARARS